MQAAKQRTEPESRISPKGLEHSVCQQKVVDLNRVRQRQNPNRYAKGKDREQLMYEINRHMIRGTPVHEIAREYNVSVSAAYNWINEVKQYRQKEAENLDAKPMFYGFLADRKERIRLLYDIANDKNVRERDRIEAFKEIRHIWSSLIDLLQGTQVFQNLLEEFGQELSQPRRDAKVLREMADFFFNGLEKAMSGASLEEMDLIGSNDLPPLHQNLLS